MSGDKAAKKRFLFLVFTVFGGAIYGEGAVFAPFGGKPSVSTMAAGAILGALVFSVLIWTAARTVWALKGGDASDLRLRLGIATALGSLVILWYLPDAFFSSDPSTHPDIPQEISPQYAIPVLIIMAAVCSAILTKVIAGAWPRWERRAQILGHSRAPVAILAITIAVWTVIASFLDIIKHHNLNVFGVNTVIADQALKSFLGDQGFMFSANAQTFGSSLIGVHTNFIYALIYPLYALVPRYETLLILANLFLALGAIPVYLLAKRHFSPLVSLLLAATYLLHPTIIGQPAAQDLSELRFAATPILFAFYFFEANRFWPFLGFSLLAMTVREDVALFVALFGLLALLRKRNILWIVVPMFVGLSYLALAVFSLIPSFNPKGRFTRLELVYSPLGANLPEMAKTFLLKPWKVIALAFSSLKHAGLVVYLFASTGLFAAFFSPAILLAAPALGENLLHFSRPNIVLYYAILLVATLFPAYILGLSRIQRLTKNRSNPALQLIAPVLIVLTLFSGASMFYQWLSPAKFKPRPNSEAIEALLRKLPDDATVVMPDYLLPKVKPLQAARFYNQVYYQAMDGTTRPGEKFFVIDTNIVSAMEARTAREVLEAAVSENREYTLIFSQDNLSLYERM